MPNKVYINPETALKFADSAQTPTKTLTLTGLATDTGRISARHDLGATARSEWYEWRATFQMGTAATVGDTIDLYLSTSDGTNPDGQEGTTDATIGSVDSLKNMTFIGSVIIDTISTNTSITSSGICRIVSRYVSVVVYNNTTVSLRANTTVNNVLLTPIPPEVQ